MINSISENVDNFFRKARESFNFLEEEYGFEYNKSNIENIEYFPDTIATLRYTSSKIGIEVYWYFASAVIGVILVELQKHNEYPPEIYFFGDSMERARAINLYTLLLLKEIADSFCLRNVRSTMISDIKLRERMITKDLVFVLDNLANLLKDNANEIINGDIKAFTRVMLFEEDLIRQEYPNKD